METPPVLHRARATTKDDDDDTDSVDSLLPVENEDENTLEQKTKEIEILVGSEVMIDNKLWHQRIQDKGCAKHQLTKMTYRKSRIMALGTKELPVYYYDLTSIAIDLSHKMEDERKMGRGWVKLPKNKTDIKLKIVERLLAMRKMGEEGYHLDQWRIVGMLSNVWGSIKPAALIHHNDRARVFGIVMTIEENRYMYQRLSVGCVKRQGLDDPEFRPLQIFQTIAFIYNNEKILIDLPPDICDVDGHEEIDPNDKIRIKITRDG